MRADFPWIKLAPLPIPPWSEHSLSEHTTVNFTNKLQTGQCKKLKLIWSAVRLQFTIYTGWHFLFIGKKWGEGSKLIFTTMMVTSGQKHQERHVIHKVLWKIKKICHNYATCHSLLALINSLEDTIIKRSLPICPFISGEPVTIHPFRWASYHPPI